MTSSQCSTDGGDRGLSPSERQNNKLIDRSHAVSRRFISCICLFAATAVLLAARAPAGAAEPDGATYEQTPHGPMRVFNLDHLTDDPNGANDH